jgi:hypothetical protein
VTQRTDDLAPGAKSGATFICPVEEITLGDVSDLTAIGAVVRIGSGGGSDPVIEVDPFGVLLREGANYDCGDRVTFRVVESDVSLSGFQIIAFIERSGLNP